MTHEKNLTSTSPTSSSTSPKSTSIISPGTLLKQAREAQTMTCAEVATRLYLSESTVIDLENDFYDHIKGELFIRGYLINYAKIMRIPEKKILAALSTLGILSPSSSPSSYTYKAASTTWSAIFIKPKSIRWLTIALVTCLLVLTIILLSHKQQHPPLQLSPTLPVSKSVRILSAPNSQQTSRNLQA